MTERSSRRGWAAVEARLRDYVRRRVDRASRDDVVGDILLRLVRHREDFESADNPLAWMYRVAANAIADHGRRRSTEKRIMTRADSELDPEPHMETQSEHDASDELARCLVPLIRRLPPRYGDALLLTAIEGATQGDAARALGLSVSGMKSRVQRGRAKLREALLRCCEIELDRRGSVTDFAPRANGCGPGSCTSAE